MYFSRCLSFWSPACSFLAPFPHAAMTGLPVGPLLPSGQQEMLSGVAWHTSGMSAALAGARHPAVTGEGRVGPSRAQAPQGHDAGGWTWDLRGLGRPCCQAPASPSEHCALPFNSRGEGVKCKAGCLFGCCWFCYCYFLKPCLLPVPMLGAVPQEPPGLPVVLGHGCVGTERGGCRPLQAVIQNHRII